MIGMRMTEHPILGAAPERPAVTFTFNGRPVQGFDGESLAAVLMAQGQLTLRHTERGGEPRGLYCGMGHCFECRVTIDGIPNVRACLTPIRDGMRVEG